MVFLQHFGRLLTANFERQYREHHLSDTLALYHDLRFKIASLSHHLDQECDWGNWVRAQRTRAPDGFGVACQFGRGGNSPHRHTVDFAEKSARVAEGRLLFFSSNILLEGRFGQFQHFHRKFKRFEFFRHLKRRETRFAEKLGIRPRLYLLICQNLISIPEASLKIWCERTSFFDIFCRKNSCPSSSV